MKKWLILIAVILVLCIIEWIRELNTFRVTQYKIATKKLNGLERECKIVFLSDLHNNRYGKDNQRLVNAIAEQNPDVILIGGDMVVGKPNRPFDVAERFVAQLTKLCPVYYANGNHEFRMKIYPEIYGETYTQYKSKLEYAGVKFLENSHVNFEWENQEIQIWGLEIPKEGYKKFIKTQLSVEHVRDAIGEADHTKCQILLAHNPGYIDTYKQWGADIILSGHLHGGVVRIPMLGGVISPQFRLFPKYSGEYTKEGETSIVVSKGLGTHTIKVRFLNPAEIIVLHVGGEKH